MVTASSPGDSQSFRGKKGPRGRGSGVAELKATGGTILGRWHLPVWFLPGYCSPRGWSPRQCIWSPRRRVSSHLTSHEQEPKVKCQTNWFLKGVIRERFFILTIICLACLQGLGSVLQILRVNHSRCFCHISCSHIWYYAFEIDTKYNCTLFKILLNARSEVSRVFILMQQNDPSDFSYTLHFNHSF